MAQRSSSVFGIGRTSSARLAEAWQRFLAPVDPEKRALLEKRWAELPVSVRTDRQVVGRQLTHCGYTMGAAYCSFGCTHCYLPRNANRAPLPTFEEMCEQIDANHRLLGDFGALQITGGDVLDAYQRNDALDELVQVVRYATSKNLVPMLMTHGQVLLDEPEVFDALVREGGLTKVAIHIDMTQAGRRGYPIKAIRSEADLHPLRQEFVELIEGVARRTARPISAAHTVTVTDRNIGSIADIIDWLCGDARRLRAFRMLSLQPEADVGRSRLSGPRATPELVWSKVREAVGLDLTRDSLQFGHQDCSSMASLLVAPRQGLRFDLMPPTAPTRKLLSEMLRVFGGVGSRGQSHLIANAQRAGLLIRHPGFLWTCLRYLVSSVRRAGPGSALRLLAAALRREASTLNIVMHNFMSAEEVSEPREAVVEERLDACSFRGAVKRDGEWSAVPMCAMNSEERESIYDRQIQQELVALGKAS